MSFGVLGFEMGGNMTERYVKCRGCEGCKLYMLDDTDPKNDFCGGFGFKREDDKSAYDLTEEKKMQG